MWVCLLSLVMPNRSEGEEIWSNSYGGSEAHDVIEADNGDFVTVGWEHGGFNTRVVVLRVNPEGETIWRRHYLAGKGNAIIELKSGEFVIAGMSDNEQRNFRGYLLMIDGDGDVVWEIEYEGEGVGLFSDFRETDEGIIVLGRWSFVGIVKVDFEGDLIWQNTISEEGSNLPCNSMVSIPNGGFAFSGTYLNDPVHNHWGHDFFNGSRRFRG